MLRRLLTIVTILFLASCGKKSPVIAGVDLPPDNNAPAGSTAQDPASGNSTGSNPEPSQNVSAPQDTPAPIVKVFDAPLVLVRGAVEQQQTAMNTAPGT
jgi:predicted small lipoprotein YifL